MNPANPADITLNSWWAQGILFPVLIGIPLSLWMAFIVTRYLDFRGAIREVPSHLYHFNFFGLSDGDYHSMDFHRQMAALRIYEILYDGGQFKSGTEINNEFSSFGTWEGNARKELTVENTLGKTQTIVMNYATMCATSGWRVRRIKPNLWAIIFGSWRGRLEKQIPRSDDRSCRKCGHREPTV